MADQPSSGWRRRRRREGEQRSESTKSVSLCGRRVCCFFNCSSSPHPPSLVPPRFERSIGRNVLALFTAGGAVGFTFPETKGTRQRGKSVKSQFRVRVSSDKCMQTLKSERLLFLINVEKS